MSINHESESLGYAVANIALLTECIDLCLVVYKHHTPNGVGGLIVAMKSVP